MADWLPHWHPVLYALLAGVMTWSVTAFGAALVLFSRRVNQKLLDAMLGFAGGVMAAASFWSLLAPAIAIAEYRPEPSWLPALVGFVLGGLGIAGLDKVLPHLHPDLPRDQAEGHKTSWRRNTLLVLAITLHNIPEGLAVGVSFGGVELGLPSATFDNALMLAVGIAIQNFPEGIAVAMPLRGDGAPRWKCFWYGQLSAAVEPVAAVIGAAAVVYAAPALPYALAFAAGAMIFVIVEELIPASHRAGNVDWATFWFMAGFAVMMTLDVALG